MTLHATQADRSIPPEIHEIGSLPNPSEEIHVLPNGLTLHVIPGGVAALANMRLLIPGGIGESPSPHLFTLATRLLPEGSISLRGEKLAETIEDFGGIMSTNEHRHYSVISISCLSSMFTRLLPLLADATFNPEFSDEAIAKQKRLLTTSISVSKQDVGYVASRTLKSMLYGADSPYVPSDSIGLIESYTRSQIAEAHRSRLCPAGMHLYIAGKLDQSMVNIAHELFSSVPAPASQLLSFYTDTLSEAPKDPVTFTPVADSLQDSVSIALPTSVGRLHSDYVALRLAVTALGGYFGSRLSLNIRETQGLTYGISASLLGYPGHSIISINSDTDPANVNRLIAEVRAELLRLMDPASYTTDEITRLRRHILSDLARQIDSPLARMMYLEGLVTASIPGTYFTDLEQQARTATPEILASVARRHIDPERMFISIAGVPPAE